MSTTHKAPELRLDADLHLYIDMSGNTSETDWKPIVIAEVAALKMLSASLNKTLLLWMTGLSHEFADNAVPVTVTSYFPNLEELDQIIETIPRTYGGTDFELVWNRVNELADHSIRDNVIVSDLEWGVNAEKCRTDHPVNLRYVAVEKTGRATRTHFTELLQEAGIFERITAVVA